MWVLSNIAKLLLSTFPTTIEEDAQLLRGAAAADEQLALRFRIEKKKILINAISRMSKRLQVGCNDCLLCNRACGSQSMTSVNAEHECQVCLHLGPQEFAPAS